MTRWHPGILAIRTRGDRVHGWGHVVRLAHVAAQAKSRYGDSLEIQVFAEGDVKVFSYLAQFDFDLIRLPSDIPLAEEMEIVSSYSAPDLSIMDMLESTPARQKAWKALGGPLVLLDELCQHEHEADVVVCAQLLLEYPNYRPENTAVTYCKGVEYFVLPLAPDASFRPSGASASRTEPYKILVMIGGGSFYSNGYKVAVEALCTVHQDVAVDATFVLGYDCDPEIKAYIKSVLPEAVVHDGVENPIELMSRSDLGIFSGGYSKYESAYVGLPIVMLAVQEHQKSIAEAFEVSGAGKYLGPVEEVSASDLATEVGSLLRDADKRQAMSQAGLELVDGQGMSRIFDAVELMVEVSGNCYGSI